MRPSSEIDVLESLLIGFIILERPQCSGADARKLADELRAQPDEVEVMIDGVNCGMETFHSHSAYLAVDRQRDVPLYVHARGLAARVIRVERILDPASFVSVQPS